MTDDGESGSAEDEIYADRVIETLETTQYDLPTVYRPDVAADASEVADRTALRPIALRRRLLRWLFVPSDQPAWARPLLFAVATLSGVAYSWGMARDSIETFYGAAARSMSESWHAFLFGAFDPWATVTVDKLPGALWLQALSIRIFGVHIWAIALPQVVEGVLTVLVMYRAVRRLAGPLAGLVAAVVLAVSPVTVLLNRGNISDSLLVLLLVFAADAASRAMHSGRLRSLVLAGVWVGLAFQTKMMQAWLVLPAVVLPYLLAAPPRLRVRLCHAATGVLIAGVVSLSWMTAVSLVPAHDRPYVDGTTNDSEFTQVFVYNGVARLGLTSYGVGPSAPFLRVYSEEGRSLTAATAGIRPSWHRLLTGPFGRADGWLLPAAVAGLVGGILATRAGDRRDQLRAATVLWGSWLGLLLVALSAGRYINAYYPAALMPAIAALLGIAVRVVGRPPWPGPVRFAVAGTVAVTVLYGSVLLRGASQVPAWLTPVALGAGAVVVLALSIGASRAATVGFVVGAPLAIGCLPAVATVTSVARGLGPFDTPFEPSGVSAQTQLSAGYLGRLSDDFRSGGNDLPRTRALFGTDTSGLAAAYVLVTGREVFPIGGYRGNVPAPSLEQIQEVVHSGSVTRFVLPVTPASDDPRIEWIEANCSDSSSLPTPSNGVDFRNFVCMPDLSQS